MESQRELATGAAFYLWESRKEVERERIVRVYTRFVRQARLQVGVFAAHRFHRPGFERAGSGHLDEAHPGGVVPDRQFAVDRRAVEFERGLGVGQKTKAGQAYLFAVRQCAAGRYEISLAESQRGVAL